MEDTAEERLFTNDSENCRIRSNSITNRNGTGNNSIRSNEVNSSCNEITNDEHSSMYRIKSNHRLLENDIQNPEPNRSTSTKDVRTINQSGGNDVSIDNIKMSNDQDVTKRQPPYPFASPSSQSSLSLPPLSSSSQPSLWSPTGKWYVDILHFIGPGWFVSVAYVDPGNYQADIQAGALSRYSLLFIVWWTSVLSIYVQVLCVRLSYRSGMTLAQVQAHHYREKYSTGVGSARGGKLNKGVIMRHLNWFIAEFSTIITDLPEVVGIGIAFNVFFGWPYYVGVLLSPITTMAFLWTLNTGGQMKEQDESNNGDIYGDDMALNSDPTYDDGSTSTPRNSNISNNKLSETDEDPFVATKRTRILEFFVAMFVAIMGISLFIEMIVVKPSFKDFMTGWTIGIKDLNRSDVFQVTGVVGAVVMPHNLYLHTAACLSRRPTVHPAHMNSAIRLSSIEPIPPIMLSFFINAAVVAIAAERIYTGNNSVSGVGLTDFCNYFQTLKGGCILWGIALLAAGQSSAITTTYAGQHVMDGFLQLRLSPAKRAILTRLLAILPCVVVSASMDGPTINRMVNFVNSMLSLLLPFAFTPLVVYNCSSDIMGQGRSFGGGQGAAVGFERVLLYGFVFAVYAVNAWGLSVKGGGFFGDLRPTMEPGVGKFSLTVMEVTFQIFYLWWNVDCILDGPRHGNVSDTSNVRDVVNENGFNDNGSIDIANGPYDKNVDDSSLNVQDVLDGQGKKIIASIPTSTDIPGGQGSLVVDGVDDDHEVI